MIQLEHEVVHIFCWTHWFLRLSLQGMSYPCPFLNKMGAMICCMTTANKYKKLDGKLERKIVEINRSSAGQRNFKSIDSVVLRFPQIREGLKTLKVIFEEYGKFPFSISIPPPFLWTIVQFWKKTNFYVTCYEDEDSNGSIDYNELKKCFEQLQVHLPEEEIKDLFRYCDIDRSKGIQFNEFIVLLCLIYLLEEHSSSDNVLGKRLGFIFTFLILKLCLLLLYDDFCFFLQGGVNTAGKNF